MSDANQETTVYTIAWETANRIVVIPAGWQGALFYFFMRESINSMHVYYSHACPHERLLKP